MASPKFNERFKNRGQILGKYGDIQISPANAIAKTPVHKSTLQSSTSYQILAPLKNIMPNKLPISSKAKLNIPGASGIIYSGTVIPSASESPIQITRRKYNLTPIRDKPKGSSNKDLKKEFIAGNFQPYTLKDYANIKHDSYFMLGNLGPSTGSEEWKSYKFKEERRKSYANKLPYIQIKGNQENRLTRSVLRSTIKRMAD